MSQSGDWQARLRTKQNEATCRAEWPCPAACLLALSDSNAARLYVACTVPCMITSRNRCNDRGLSIESIPCETGDGRCFALEFRAESGRDITLGASYVTMVLLQQTARQVHSS